MYSYVTSGTIFGIQGLMIQVEADCSDGLPSFHLVGSLSQEVRESGERIRTALRNSGFSLPPRRIVINLSPADIRKEGSGFDLPIAVAALVSMGKISQEQISSMAFVGELSLNGGLLPVTGILPIADAAAKAGCRFLVLPKANREEAALVEGLQVLGVDSLTELLRLLRSEADFKQAIYHRQEKEEKAESLLYDFKDLKGQPVMRRAMEVAASGMHNLLMTGPPGAGKTLTAKCLTGILPDLSLEESMELTKIYSVRGLLPKEGGRIRKRPFRSPHHTVTTSSLIGGGFLPRPGEISLAHNGVLFLDELPEFSRAAVEALRQPLEDGVVVIGRLNRTCRFPANIMLVGAMNPCPCGCYPDRNRCSCSPRQIINYQNRVSRALLDRMDLQLSVRPVTYEEMTGDRSWESSAAIRQRVSRVHEIQRLRYQGTGIQFNAQLDPAGLRQYCSLDEEGEGFMRRVFDSSQLSARGYHRILKLARTIADMEASGKIRRRHLMEAVAYRLTGQTDSGGGE